MAIKGHLANALCATGLVAAVLAVVAPTASATNRVYWTNFQLNGSIAFSNLDGSGSGGSVNVGGASVIWTAGVGIDPAANKVYWANYDPGNTISFANLDESGAGGKLNTSPVTPNKPAGVVVDAARGRIYWADMGDNKIEFANLDGTGGGFLDTGLATVKGPEGVAVDHAAQAPGQLREVGVARQASAPKQGHVVDQPFDWPSPLGHGVIMKHRVSGEIRHGHEISPHARDRLRPV